MQVANRVAKNTGILYAKMAITVFISLYATRLVLAALGTKDFGLFSVVGGAIAMLGFLNASMAAATQRFMSFAQGAGDFHKINRIFNMSVLLHLIIAIIIFIVLEIAGYFFFNGILNIDPDRLDTSKLIYQFMVVSTIFSVISVPYDALLNAHENMLFYAILGIIESVLKLAIALYLTFINADKLLYYGALMAALSIILLIINRIYCHHRYPETKLAIKAQYDKKLLKEMSRFAGWSLLGSSSSMVSNYGQGIVVNVFFGTAVNAAQGIAAQISGQLGVFAGTMMKSLSPVIAKSEGAGNRSQMLKASFMGSKISFFLLMLLHIPVLIEMPLIFKFWLKEVPEFAIIFCRLLLIRILIEQLFLTLTISISAVGNIRKFQIFNSILNFLPLVISYILFSFNYPPYFIYIVFIFYAIAGAIITLYFAKKDCSLSISNYFDSVIYKCLVSFMITIAISALPVLFMSDGIIRLLFILIISTITSLIVIWNVGFSLTEREGIWKILKRTLEKISRK